MNSEKMQIFLKQYLPVLIMGVLSIGVGVLIFLRMGLVDDLTTEIEEKSSDFQRMERIISLGQGLEDDLDRIKEFEERLAPRLLTFEQFDTIGAVRDRQRIMGNVNRLVETSLGTPPRDLRLTPGSLDEMTFYRTIQFVLEVEGSLTALQKLLFDLEAAENLTRLDSIHLRSVEGGQTQNLLGSIRFEILANRPSN
ncbi:MAG: hypothetical protein LAT55_03005 [Opitutales bacterium]|nr:hypothetical protein [Opitutales bacterium]